jgi:hypothetical protein
MLLQKLIHLLCTCYDFPWNIETTSIVQYHDNHTMFPKGNELTPPVMVLSIVTLFFLTLGVQYDMEV